MRENKNERTFIDESMLNSCTEPDDYACVPFRNFDVKKMLDKASLVINVEAIVISRDMIKFVGPRISDANIRN